MLQTEGVKIDWQELSTLAWKVYNNAHIYGKTKVGCAILSGSLNMYTGCNIEQIFRSHDIHAEVNAISSMVAYGEKILLAILVVARRERFTPCGSCMDWIFQFGGAYCQVGFQNEPNGPVEVFTSDQLMPFYPK